MLFLHFICGFLKDLCFMIHFVKANYVDQFFFFGNLKALTNYFHANCLVETKLFPCENL